MDDLPEQSPGPRRRSPSNAGKWNQFKMLMLLPTLGPSSKKTASTKMASPSYRGKNRYDEQMPKGRKRSNSAISLLFGGSYQRPTGDLASLQQPYSSLMAPSALADQIDDDENSTSDNLAANDLTGRRMSFEERPDSSCNSVSSSTAERQRQSLGNNNSNNTPLSPRALDRRVSADDTRHLLHIEAAIADFRHYLAIFKEHLNEDSFSKSQLETDANGLLSSLYRVLATCPEIANAVDLHTLASQLIRLATSGTTDDGVASGNNNDGRRESSESSSSPSPSPSPAYSGIVVAQSVRGDISRCVDSLAVLLIRRLSRHISASILTDLREPIIDEENPSSLASASRQQPEDSFNKAASGANFSRYGTASSRLARSMNDVSSLVGGPVVSESSNDASNVYVAAASSLTHADSTVGTASPLLAAPSLAATLGEDLDLIVGKLCRSDGSVEALLEQLRLADRYLKDIASYVEKRTMFYLDYVKSLNKLANNIKPALSGTAASTTVPLQYIFLPFVQHDVEYTSLALRSCQAQLSEREGFVTIVTERRNELKRAEKNIQDKWSRVVGFYVSAMSEMRKAHQQYERAVDALALRRDEAGLSKEADAQIQLRTKIMEVNHKLAQLEKTKADCLYEIIRQIGITETTLKETSEKYFHFISVVICEHPSVYEAMRSQSRCIEVGSQFMSEVRRIITDSNQFIFEPIEFEQLRKSVKAQNDGGASLLASSISSMIPLPRAFRVPLTVITSFDSDDESPSRSSSPPPPDGADSISTDQPSTSSVASNRRRKDRRHEALGHLFSKLRTSSARCAICRTSVVYEHGIKCDKCGLVFHRKCIESNPASCDSRRRSPIFGIELAAHLADTGQPVPLVLQKCIASLERDALSVKGIYRVPGSKKQIEAVCRALEEGSGNSVNLDEEQPHVLTGIVKSYLLQLPEPLLTNKIAATLLRASRDDRLTVEDLQIAVKRLPEPNYLTCGLILQHLRVVANHADENQMTIGNLAIIFGPTLLLSVLRGQQNSMVATETSEMWSTSMADTAHASKVVEKLLTHFEITFENLPLFLADLRRLMNGGEVTSNNNNNNNNQQPTSISGSPTRSAVVAVKSPTTPLDEAMVVSTTGSASKIGMSRQTSNPLLASSTSINNSSPSSSAAAIATAERDEHHQQPPASVMNASTSQATAAATLGSSLTQSASSTSSPASSKQGSPVPPMQVPHVPDFPTIIPFRASTGAISSQSTQLPHHHQHHHHPLPSNQTPSLLTHVQQLQQQQQQPLDSTLSSPAHLPAGADTSIQSASDRVAPVTKKMNNVIVRL